MSIVAHQYNILSEQLRKGIGGLNKAKLQESESALKMAQLQYGIQKDVREGERADERLQLAKDRQVFEEKKYADQASSIELMKQESKAKLDQRNTLIGTPINLDNVLKIVDTEGTMNRDTAERVYNQAVEATGAKNMFEAVENPLFKMIMMQATDEEHRQKTIDLYKGQLQEYTDKFGTRGGANQQFQGAYDAKKEALQKLEEAKANPIQTAEKKLDVLNRFYAQIVSPEARKKAEFLINQQQDRVDALRKAEADRTSGKGMTATTIYSERNPYTGKIESRQVTHRKGTEAPVPKGWSLHKPVGEGKMDVIDTGNRKALRTRKMKGERALAWAQTYGEMSELQLDLMKADPEKRKQIASYGEFSNISELIGAIREDLEETRKAQFINDAELDNEFVYEFAQYMGWTYQEAFNHIARNPDQFNIRD